MNAMNAPPDPRERRLTRDETSLRHYTFQTVASLGSVQHLAETRAFGVDLSHPEWAQVAIHEADAREADDIKRTLMRTFAPDVAEHYQRLYG